jgi:DNA mismatch endonuclease (patch repair protein)
MQSQVLKIKTVKQYSRDKRSPVPKHENTSKVMSANKAKNSKPEQLLRKSLRDNGLKGYRLHWKNAPGRPDIAFVGKKLAIFINGCFWHRCPTCAFPLPKHNTEFWKNKFEKNVFRDERKKSDLLKLGWKVLTIWECAIKQDVNNIIPNVINHLR